jgi:hypothetical protein
MHVRPHECVAFDLEFASSEGFSAPSAVEQPPAVQLAFEYTVIMPVRVRAASAWSLPAPDNFHDAISTQVTETTADAPQRTSGAEPSISFVRERRRRIVTVPAKVARSRRQIFETCDAEATAVLLAHKALRAAASDGVGEARLMLTDWLAALVARASEAFPSGSGATPDASLSACAPLAPLPRAVFGLLCSPLLRALRAHPDARAHAAHLVEALPPDALACLLYPRMVSWRDADLRVEGEHALARSAMAAAGTPLFVVDALTTVVVYAVPSPPGMPQEPFPPAHKVRSHGLLSCCPALRAWCLMRSFTKQSALRGALNALRDARPRTPRVLFIRGGVDDVTPLEALLLDDDGADGGLTAFLAHIGAAAQDMLTQGQ